MLSIKKNLSLLNKSRKNFFAKAFVSRKRYDKVKSGYDFFVKSLSSFDFYSVKNIPIECIKTPQNGSLTGDCCFFVSYSPNVSIKPHVKLHIESLVREGIKVVLILNVDNSNGADLVSDELYPTLTGLYIRENVGFDFAAWSSLFSILSSELRCKRLFLVNDSVIGPLNQANYKEAIDRIRKNSANVIGLTLNINPKPHLQSYFLMLDASVVSNETFKRFFSNLWVLPTKDLVIDMYEINLTSQLQKIGFTIDALFSDKSKSEEEDVYHEDQIEGFIERGFPFIKANSVKKPKIMQVLKRYLPEIAKTFQ